MAIKLLIHDHTTLLEPIVQEWDQTLVTFGRSKSCNVELNNPEISRRHFVIKFKDTSYFLIDEGSRHGTMLDNSLVIPHQEYKLSKDHIIQLPGYGITLSLDGKPPKLDRTSVVTRQLLDELLQEKVKLRACPCLQSSEYLFKFTEDKVSFVLGASADDDFVVLGKDIAKKHVSFARDINGIRMIVLPNHPVYQNTILVTESVLLVDGDVIKIGDTEFYFYEDGEKHKKDFDTCHKIENQTTTPPVPTTPEPRAIDGLNHLFIAAILLAMGLASFLLYEII